MALRRVLIPDTLRLGHSAGVDTDSIDQTNMGSDMAAGSDISSDGSGEMAAHVRSYDRFTWMMKWGTIICAIVGFIVVFGFIA